MCLNLLITFFTAISLFWSIRLKDMEKRYESFHFYYAVIDVALVLGNKVMELHFSMWIHLIT